jgi:hypothetical protein
MTTSSAAGKLERALRQLENIEGLIGGLPRIYRNNEEKRSEFEAVLDQIKQLRIKIKHLEQLIIDEDEGQFKG